MKFASQIVKKLIDFNTGNFKLEKVYFGKRTLAIWFKIMRLKTSMFFKNFSKFQ